VIRIAQLWFCFTLELPGHGVVPEELVEPAGKGEVDKKVDNSKFCYIHHHSTCKVFINAEDIVPGD